MSSPVGKDPHQTHGFYVMPFHEKMDYKCQRKMTYCNDVDDVDERDSTYAMTTASEDIHYIETTNEWS
ncbi:retrotransposon protein [Cucumis melo var. makuwa]|uniref:Retrotransposon protein n=1 Tax=Cucumis melo var. makuwa TaxID=1194695 RepID=A0A5D3BAZ8_CUCMM|nr:retrotransposon protein [Cucumis melo var. makuwa]